eukprot:SAG31_NODE_3920_length_3750_cov_18.007121_2_plen_41_part_00
MKMFDLAWYVEWEEGGDAPTWGKTIVGIELEFSEVLVAVK